MNSKWVNGFTMIELLLVIVLVGVLTAVAVPKFLDFRNEGKKAKVISNLNTYRLALKLAMTQAKLRCSANNYPVNSNGVPIGLYHALYYGNNITTHQADATNIICTQAQVPDYRERILVNQTETVMLRQASTIQYHQQLANPFVDYNVANVYVIYGVSQATLDAKGGPCGFVAYLASVQQTSHWAFNNDTGDMFPATNVLGECNL